MDRLMRWLWANVYLGPFAGRVYRRIIRGGGGEP